MNQNNVLKNQTQKMQLKKNLYYKKACKTQDLGNETEINSQKKNQRKSQN